MEWHKQTHALNLAAHGKIIKIKAAETTTKQNAEFKMSNEWIHKI
jgi:hypothetical protein